MALSDVAILAGNGAFQARVQAAIIAAAISIYNEVLVDQQTITMGAVTAGTFTLTFLGQTTTALQWNSSAQAIQAALNLLTTIGAGGVECTGGPLPGTGVVVNFTSLMIGGQTPMTHTDTLTGGVATITHTTVGTWIVNHTKRAALGTKVLANTQGYAQLMSVGVAAATAVQTDYLGGESQQASVTDTDINNAVASMWNAYS
jgi:hypothetical protein